MIHRMWMNFQIRGLLYALAAAAVSALAMVFVHDAKSIYSASELVLARSVTFVVVLLPFTIRQLDLMVSRDSLWLWLRGVAAAIAVVLYYATIQKSAIAQAAALFAITPLVVAVLSHFMIGERVSRSQVAGCAVVILGICVMQWHSHPARMGMNILLFGLISVVLRSLAFISLRQAARKFSPSLNLFTLSLVTLAVVLLWDPRIDHLIEHGTEPVLWAVICTSALMQWLMILTFKHLSATSSTLVDQTEIIWAAVFGIIFHGYWPLGLEWIAFATILAGVSLGQRQAKS